VDFPNERQIVHKEPVWRRSAANDQLKGAF
jgi:hypothetical protein